MKQQIVRTYARRHGITIFVETGTCYGDMIESVRNVFDEIYSIELGQELYAMASERFAGAKNITLLQGDSGAMLPVILPRIRKPCLFWLDAHYSAGVTARGALETPIALELAHILRHALARRHIILIDDARCFTGKNDYPTLQALKETVAAAGFDQFEVQDDVVRIRATERGAIR